MNLRPPESIMAIQLSLALVDAEFAPPFAYAAAQPLPLTTAAVYSLLSDRNLPAMPARDTLAAILGVSVRTVGNAISRLTAADLIKDSGRRQGKTGRVKVWDTLHRPLEDTPPAAIEDTPPTASPYGKVTSAAGKLIQRLIKEVVNGTTLSLDQLSKLVDLEPANAADADAAIKSMKAIKMDPRFQRRRYGMTSKEQTAGKAAGIAIYPADYNSR